MNERIKELAEQAGFVMWADESWNPGDVIDWGSRYDAELKKFAKLIVSECAQRCEDIAIKHQVEETTYAAGKKAGAFECASDLKKHFGVEE